MPKRLQPLSIALCFDLSDLSPEDDGIFVLPLIPSGSFVGNDGRNFSNPYPDAIVSAFKNKLPFDIEHSTEIKAAKGEEAPAVGWIESLENRNGTVYGLVKFNDAGKWRLRDKSYKYYSPAFYHDDSGVIYAISSAGLTNKPNLDLPALNRVQETSPPTSKNNQKVNNMKLPLAITLALGLNTEATEEQVVSSITLLKNDKEIALNSANHPSLEKFIPKETHELALNSEKSRADVAEGKLKTIADKESDGLVEKAITEGKIAPANKDMYVSLCRTEAGRTQFESFVKSAPTIVDSKPVKTKVKEGESEALEEHEIAMCRKLNMTHEDFTKSKNRIALNQENK